MASSVDQSCRKRERPEDLFSDVGEASPKRPKTTSSYYPARFWDTLSTVRLSRRALKELDRRDEQTNTLSVKLATTLPSTNRCLLRSDIRRLRQIVSKGGPDLSTLRGYSCVPTVTMSQSSSPSRKPSHPSPSRGPAPSKTATTTPYSVEFEQKMIDQGVFPEFHEDADGNSVEPGNLDEICEVLQQARESLSPSRFPDSAFQEFQRDNRREKSDSMVRTSVLPVIAGSKDAKYYASGGVVFNQLQKFDPDIPSAKPGIYYGARPAQIHRRVRQELGEYIVPSGHQTLPAAPNFFFEGKGASGRSDVAQRQAMHDAALGARGMLHLQNYGSEETVYDGNAYTLSARYFDGQLKLYATHPKKSNVTGHTEYHMTQVDNFAMTGNVRGFRSGAAAYRNARDWAEEQRNRFIEAANVAAQSTPSQTTWSRLETAASLPTATQESTSPATSEDELDREALPRRKQRRV